MNAITVLYDEQCPLCIRSARWLQNSETFVQIECLPAGSAEVLTRFPGLATSGKKQLVVVDDEGGIYRDGDAWLMCLWALVDYREWAKRLASPSMKPLARAAFEVLSNNRKALSRWLWSDDVALTRQVKEERFALGDCEDGACELPARDSVDRIVMAQPWPPRPTYR